MNTTTQHTTQYKNSALGLIPEDWEVKKFKQVAKFYSGGTPLTSVREYYEGDIPFIKSGEIYGEKTEQFLNEMALKNSSAKMVCKGDILYALYGANSGEVAVSKINGAINQAILCIKTELNNLYVFNFLIKEKDIIVKKYLQGGQGNLSADIVKKLDIPIPPLPEQAAIANCLSTWDKAIEKHAALIAQKELSKKALMQQLLSGKKRLKGFNEEWKEVRMNDVFKHIKNINDGGDTHSIMTISSKLGLISQEDKFDRVIAGDSLKKYTQLKKGDFAYNKGNSKTYPMGCVYQLDDKESALVPFVYICFSPTEFVDSKLYKHWFFDHGLDRQLNKIITSGARGDGLLNVSTNDFFNLKIALPPKEEQTAIATVLQCADREIQLLKNKLAQLKDQKKGLMQVLLTGKKRLNY